MDILQKGEYLTSCLYAFSMLFLPFSFIFANVAIGVSMGSVKLWGSPTTI